MKAKFQEYEVKKIGEEDPEAIYFVLRLDNDPHARQVARHYSQLMARTNMDLAKKLVLLLNDLDDLLVMRGK